MVGYTVASWASRGELDFAFTLYHNGRSDYDVEFGHGWSCTFGAKLYAGTDVTIRWGDGTVVVFTEVSEEVYAAPTGCFDTLEVLGSGNYLVTAPDLTEFEFTPQNAGISGDLGDLVAIRDRNGNQITMTISTINGKERLTKVEDCVTSRYIELDYNTSTHYVETITDHTAREWTIDYTGSKLDELFYPELDSQVFSREFTYEVDLSNNHFLASETDLRGELWEFTYDDDGRIESAENPLGKTTTYGYSDSGTTITHPGGKTTEHNYSDGLLASEVDEAGFSVNYLTYNSNRLATEVEDKNENTWTFTFNSKGNVLTATNPLAKTTTYVYETNGNDLNTVTNAESDVWDFNYYLTGAKNLKEVYDPKNRRLALYDYNAHGDVDSIKDADNEETVVSYGSDGYPDSVTDPLGKTSVVNLDSLGRVTWVEDPIQALTTGTSEDRTDISYDEWDRQTVVTHPVLEGEESRYTTQFTYDEGGNILSVIDERGQTVTFEYDAAGQLTDVYNQKNEHEVIQYTDRGWVWKVTNGRGKIRTYTYTDRGELYYYSLPVVSINTEGEIWSYDGNGNATAHGYFKAGLSSGSETKSYTYDVANRLTLVNYNTGSMTNVSFDWDDADRKIEMVDGTGTTEWTYVDGDLTEMISPQGTIQYGYDANARLDELTEVIPGGSNIVTAYTYDEAGRTDTVTKFGETTTFEYDDASRPEKMIYDSGAYALYTYDGRSRIKSVEHKNSSNTLLRKETNTYDAASRITSRYEGPTSGGVTTTFGYDDVGQLTSESSSGYSSSYTYDAKGNRATRTVNSVTETYTVDDADKLTSVTWSSGGNNYEKAYAYHYSGRVTGIT